MTNLLVIVFISIVFFLGYLAGLFSGGHFVLNKKDIYSDKYFETEDIKSVLAENAMLREKLVIPPSPAYEKIKKTLDYIAEQEAPGED